MTCLGAVVIVGGAIATAIRWRRYPVLVWASPLIVGLLIAAGVVVSVLAFRLDWPRTDRLALLTYIAAVAALFLAVAAALLAVASYRQSNELPDLDIHVQFHPVVADKAVLVAKTEENWVHPAGNAAGTATFRILEASADSDLRCEIVVENSGKVSATHVAVRVTLIGLDGLNTAQRGWDPVVRLSWDLNPVSMGCTGMQWDGGGDVVVHPGFPRHLPMLDLTGARALRGFRGPRMFLLDASGQPVLALFHCMILEVVADGVSRNPVRREVRIEVVESEQQQRDRLSPLMQPALENRGWSRIRDTPS